MNEQRLGSDRARAVLWALDFTPELLAVALNTTKNKAKRILEPGGKVYFDEMVQILLLLRNISPNLLVEGAGMEYGNQDE